jgi:eukaryotic-like serine/threonine-protein kinase
MIGLPAVPQSTVTGSLPVPIPGLPSDLNAFPVYRVRTSGSGRESRDLLRLEVWAAIPQRAEAWQDALAALDTKERHWLLKSRSGKASVITRKFGSETLALLYKWCAGGIVTFQVQVPPEPNSGHGLLLDWRLTDPVQDHVRVLAVQSQARHAALEEEASRVASELAGHRGAGLLAAILAEPRSDSYLEHTITVARGYLASRPEPHTGHTDPSGTREILARLARGFEKDYAKDPKPLDGGGQGTVFGSVHKVTGVRVAFKRRRFHDDHARARMRHEIQAGQLFGGHPNVMPVLDADPEGGWFIMPLAEADAARRAGEMQDTAALRSLVEAVCEGLRIPHEKGWIHRDIKPGNILLLDGRWTVGDWGLGRGARGQTSDPDLTRSGTGFGTEGYAAPELSEDAHEATEAADIYSLGQVIGAVLTRSRPQANTPLLPPPGPWRAIVEEATRRSPADRPQDVSQFLRLLKNLPD